LIKKGYKGNPSDYFKIHKENKMTGQEIQELIVGKTMAGFAIGTQWSKKITKSGESETTDFQGNYKGKIWIEGDAVYEQFETRYKGLRDCCEIYKNPEGNKTSLSEYIFLTDWWIFPFSIIE
jgi:hypothetical protein